jgi:hypothetical protein
MCALSTLKTKNGDASMSGDKEKMDQIVQRIDELLAVMRDVSEDLKTVSASLKSMAVAQITAQPAARASSPSASPKPATPAPAAATAPKSQNIEDIRMMFPQELDTMLAFEDKGDYVMIKPKQFLGSENFAKIASTVRGIGGEYISAGRDSHFRVYKKKA